MTARIAYVDFDGAGAQTAAGRQMADGLRDDGFLEECRGGVVRAVDLICDWFRG